MPKIVKHLFRHLKKTALFIQRPKRIYRTKVRLHQNLKKIQEGHNIQAGIKEMRVMSRMLYRTQYGTTKHLNDPLKLDIMQKPVRSKKISEHGKDKIYNRSEERHR